MGSRKVGFRIRLMQGALGGHTPMGRKMLGLLKMCCKNTVGIRNSSKVK